MNVLPLNTYVVANLVIPAFKPYMSTVIIYAMVSQICDGYYDNFIVILVVLPVVNLMV